LDRPLVLVPLVPRRFEDPLLLVPLVPRRSEDLLLLGPLVPRTPTCAIWLYHLFFDNSLFSGFFWISQCHSIFRKTLLTENFLQNTIMFERTNNKKISTKRQRQP